MALRSVAWNTAIYTREGQPSNLAAAANDALEWLRCFSVWHPRMSEEDRLALVRCLEMLEKFLKPHLPYVFEEKVGDVLGEPEATSA